MDWPLKIKETGMSLWVNKFRIQYCNKFEKRFSLEYIQWLPQFVFPWGKVFFTFLRVQLHKGNVQRKKEKYKLFSPATCHKMRTFSTRAASKLFYLPCKHNLVKGEGRGVNKL